MAAQIKHIPTNIITGFLGVGKTTAILYLLKNKPDNESWAVLVNEFGEIGLDKSLMVSSEAGLGDGVFIRQVAGGCMCCAAGVPMKVALNELLKQAKPDRLLIEPTGLGHPKEVLAVLSGEHYKEVLDVQNTITLVDAKHIKDERYSQHEIFRQQLSIADLIIANKSDTYQADDLLNLQTYLQDLNAGKQTRLITCQHGDIDIADLHSANVSKKTTGQVEYLGFSLQGDIAKSASSHQVEDIKQINQAAFLSVFEGKDAPTMLSKQADGFMCLSWAFSDQYCFDRGLFEAVFTHCDFSRLKATIICKDGHYAYNNDEGVCAEPIANKLSASLIEVIMRQPQTSAIDVDMSKFILSCLV